MKKHAEINDVFVQICTSRTWRECAPMHYMLEGIPGVEKGIGGTIVGVRQRGLGGRRLRLALLSLLQGAGRDF